MKYCLGVYGDSISFGYGNDDISWFDKLEGFSNKLKLSENGETIDNVLSKILDDNNQYKVLILAVGVNNFFQDIPQFHDCNMQQTILQYEKVINIAKNKSDNLIIQNLLPIIEERFPNQKYLDEPKWIYNHNIVKFNTHLTKLATKYNAQLIDMFDVFNGQNLYDLYFDGVHPNMKGQNLLFDIYQEKLKNFCHTREEKY